MYTYKCICVYSTSLIFRIRHCSCCICTCNITCIRIYFYDIPVYIHVHVYIRTHWRRAPESEFEHLKLYELRSSHLHVQFSNPGTGLKLPMRMHGFQAAAAKNIVGSSSSPQSTLTARGIQECIADTCSMTPMWLGLLQLSSRCAAENWEFRAGDFRWASV